MDKFKCDVCGLEFDTIKSMSQHRSYKHNICAEDTYTKYILNGVTPKCKCGCGLKPKFLTITNGYREFIRGHSSKINNNWGHNEDALKKSHETQKQLHKDGKLTIWNKGLTIEDPRVKNNVNKIMSNPNRGKNISKSLSGKRKTDIHKENLSKSQIVSWSCEKKRQKQRDNRMNYIIENGLTPTSKLEEIFNNILFEKFNFIENVDYYRQFYVRDIRSLFDFKIAGKKILIEIDGNYWHCNPNSKFKIPIYEAQKNNIKKDIIKNKWCEDNNFKLLRFWEDDILNNPEMVISELVKNIN